MERGCKLTRPRPHDKITAVSPGNTGISLFSCGFLVCLWGPFYDLSGLCRQPSGRTRGWWSGFAARSWPFPATPNSAHSAGRAAREELDRITASIAALLGAEPEEVIYTSGATESNNLAIKGWPSQPPRGAAHPVHPAGALLVGGSLTALQNQGYEIDLLDVDRRGQVDLEQFRDLLRKDTVLLSLSAVDSELGTVQPLEEVREILKEYPNCRVHVDATQAVGRIPVRFTGCDTMSLALHKIGGLNGSGLLLKRKGLVLEPLLHGGASTTIYRSGTPTLALAAAAEEALRRATGEREERTARVARPAPPTGGRPETISPGARQQPCGGGAPHSQPQRGGGAGQPVPAGPV